MKTLLENVLTPGYAEDDVCLEAVQLVATALLDASAAKSIAATSTPTLLADILEGERQQLIPTAQQRDFGLFCSASFFNAVPCTLKASPTHLTCVPFWVGPDWNMAVQTRLRMRRL